MPVFPNVGLGDPQTVHVDAPSQLPEQKNVDCLLLSHSSAALTLIFERM